MSIDARVNYVVHNEDGSGELRLVDRPPRRPGDDPGIAGQRVLAYAEAPEEVTALNGCDIWGGSGDIMLGDKRIAYRRSYTGIEFVDGEAFKDAVRAYRRKESPA